MTEERLNVLRSAFSTRFGGHPSFIARAPGRVNLIGEHTDYNAGFVLPFALEFDVLIAARPRMDETVVARSMDCGNEDASFPLVDIEKTGPGWVHYIKGIAWSLQQAGYDLRGMDMIIQGDVPMGSGLSSNAALEMSACVAFDHAAGLNIPGPKKAELCKKTENEFIGVPSGIMDQFASANATKGHALFLDCRDLSFEQVPFNPSEHGLSLLVAHTGVPRALQKSVYQDRVTECAQAVEWLRQFLPHVQALRDVTFDEFQVYQPKMPEVLRQRARHVITENARVLGAVEALRADAIEALGPLMNASHESLRADYDVTGENLDALVEESRRIPGTLGSRMTGAGFGGCAITLIAADAVDRYRREVPPAYEARTGLEPIVWEVHPGPGAGIV